MIILVSGGAGFIGSAVVRLAIARGHQVVNFDALTYAACLDKMASVADHPNYAFEQLDMRGWIPDRMRRCQTPATLSAH